MQAPQDELRKWAAELDKQIIALQLEIRPKQERLATLQKQRSAVDVLLNPENQRSAANIQANSWARREAYDVPLLEALVDLGGSGSTEQVLRRLKEKMETKGLLGTDDYKDVPGGTEERWRNSARWRRFELVKRGFLSRSSTRGIWEIAEEGRAWLRKQVGSNGDRS